MLQEPLYNLASRIRPKNLDELVGQDHLVGPGKPITRMVEAKALDSMILYGPPGIGKTTIAMALSGTTGYPFRKFNAANDAKKDLQQFYNEGQRLIILVDEIHRLRKPEQDYLLKMTETGQFVLIGATTENPYINLQPALRSRSNIFELKPLSYQEIAKHLRDVLNMNSQRTGLQEGIDVPEETLNFIARSVNGDVRKALNTLEKLVNSADLDKGISVTPKEAEPFLNRLYVSGDKDGDIHYDLLSALQKSIRGSDVNAALHYTARLLAIGDLVSLTRRLEVMAYEDISIADTDVALKVGMACEAAHRLGLPEASMVIAQAVIILATSPKSNLVERAINQALRDIEHFPNISIPDHLRDTHYKGADQLGRGIGYLYPHDFDYSLVKQQYMPDELIEREYIPQASDTKKRTPNEVKIIKHVKNLQKHTRKDH